MVVRRGMWLCVCHADTYHLPSQAPMLSKARTFMRQQKRFLRERQVRRAAAHAGSGCCDPHDVASLRL